MEELHPDIKKIIFSKETLQNRIKELAAQISKDYEGLDLAIVCVMKGAAFFTIDLIKYLTIPATVDFITVSSYGSNTVSSGIVKLLKDVDIDLHNKHVLVTEDILDTGQTLSYLIKHLNNKKPASIKICALLNKPHRRKFEIPLAYSGFIISDVFIVGYGMDYDHRYRDLAYMGELKPEIYQEPFNNDCKKNPKSKEKVLVLT